MINRYSFPDEVTAKQLLETLIPKGSSLSFKDITVTELTNGINAWGFEDKFSYDPKTDKQVLIKKGTTYNVDVMWKTSQPKEWAQYEIKPVTPNHKFAVII